MMGILAIFQLLLISEIIVLFSSADATSKCLETIPAPSNSRGVNKSNKNGPYFKLHVTPFNQASADNSLKFRIKVKSTNPLILFKDAQILFKSNSTDCGAGTPEYNQKDFFERNKNQSCPKLVATKRKPSMLESPELQWSPPDCGCVLIRVMVLEDGDIYYMDTPERDDLGPLSHVICVQQPHQAQEIATGETRTQRLHKLCSSIHDVPSPDIVINKDFLQRRQLHEKWMDKFGLELALEQRRSEIKSCCGSSTETGKLDCFKAIRMRRIDGFCKNGFPDMAFTSFRLEFMAAKEQKCCKLIGDLRYDCFNEGAMHIKPSPEVKISDFSLNEMDPVNDLALFTSGQKVTKHKPKKNKIDTTIISKESSAESIEALSVLPHEDDEESREAKTRIIKTFVDERKEKPAIQPDVENVKSDIPKSTTHPLKPMNPLQKLSSIEKRKLRKKGKRTFGIKSAERMKKRGSRERRLRRESRERFSSKRRRNSREYFDSRDLPYRVSPNGDSLQVDLPVIEDSYSLDFLSRVGSRRQISAERRRTKFVGSREKRIGDEGGHSVDKTLNKLHRRMAKLKLLSECCESGASTGSLTYGLFAHVWEECEHGGNKYVEIKGLVVRQKVCQEKYRECCVEMAIRGPMMSSSEFRRKYNPHLPENKEETVDSYGYDSYDEDIHPYNLDRDGSERRYQSMRRPIVNEDDDRDGPALFDEVDNNPDDDDNIDNKDKTLNIQVTEKENVKDTKDASKIQLEKQRNNSKIILTEEKMKKLESVKKKIKSVKPEVNKMKLIKNETENPQSKENKSVILNEEIDSKINYTIGSFENETTKDDDIKHNDNNASIKDSISNDKNADGLKHIKMKKGDKIDEDSEELEDNGVFIINNQDLKTRYHGGKNQGENTKQLIRSHRPLKEHKNQNLYDRNALGKHKYEHSFDMDTPILATVSKRLRKSRRKGSKSGGKSRKIQRRASRERIYKNQRKAFKSKHRKSAYNNVVALDSKEMAAVHKGHYYGNLDSKELADAYKQNARDRKRRMELSDSPAYYVDGFPRRRRHYRYRRS